MPGPDEFRIAERPAIKRPRRRTWTRIVWYLTSLIPAILVGLNFEACRKFAINALGGKPVEEIRAAQPPAPQQAINSAAGVSDPGSRSVAGVSDPGSRNSVTGVYDPGKPASQRPATVSRTAAEHPDAPRPPAARETPVTPPSARAAKPNAPPKPARPAPDLTIQLDLTRERQRCECPGIPADARLEILALDGVHGRYAVDPDDNILADRLRITFAKPQKHWIEITPDRKGPDLALWIKYSVEGDDGRARPLTVSNIARIRRRIQSAGKQNLAALADLQTEKARLDAWIDAPGTKTIAALGAAKRRVKELEHMIPTLREQISAQQATYKVAYELSERAKTLDGAKIELAVAGLSDSAQ
jgi:hypothetical protein